METVLIVDDEKEIVELIDFYMKSNGYTTYKANSGKEALDILEKEKIDLIILDIMMPGMSGKDVLKTIRAESDIPIIFISAKGEDIDKIDGLFIGADDYLAKPFNPMELLARVKAILRRTNIFNKDKNIKEDTNKLYVVGDLRIDEESCKFFKRDREIELTSYEYKLISFFIKNRNKVFTKAKIYERVWGEIYLGDESIVMVYISRLREKIEDNPKNPIYIKTIRGLGYLFEGK